MSHSSPPSADSSSRVRLYVDAHDENIEVSIFDGWLQPVATDHNIGRIEVQLTTGLYRIQFRAGRATADKWVALPPGEQTVYVELDEPLAFESSAPLSDTSTALPAHEAKASSLSTSDPTRLDSHTGGGRLFLFVRHRGSYEKNPAAGLSLHDLDGSQLIDVAEAAVCETGNDPWACLHLEMDPGPYRLRLDTGADIALEQLVMVCPDWQTQLFFLLCPFGAEGTDLRADFGNMSALMARIGVGFDPSSDQLRSADTARKALQGRRAIAPREVNDLLWEKYQNPMAGIFGAYLHLRRRNPNPDLLNTVISNLEPLVGRRHPDVAILKLALAQIEQRELGELVSDFEQLGVLGVPPTLSASWQVLVAASEREAGLVPQGSLADRIVAELWNADPWLAWRHTEAMAQAPQAAVEEIPFETAVNDMAKALQAVGLHDIQQMMAAPQVSDLERQVAQVAYTQASEADREEEKSFWPLAAQTSSRSASAPLRTLGIPTGTAQRAVTTFLTKLKDVYTPQPEAERKCDEPFAIRPEEFCYQIVLLGAWNDALRENLKNSVDNEFRELASFFSYLTPTQTRNRRCPQLGIWLADGKPVDPQHLAVLTDLQSGAIPIQPVVHPDANSESVAAPATLRGIDLIPWRTDSLSELLRQVFRLGPEQRSVLVRGGAGCAAVAQQVEQTLASRGYSLHHVDGAGERSCVQSQADLVVFLEGPQGLQDEADRQWVDTLLPLANNVGVGVLHVVFPTTEIRGPRETDLSTRLRLQESDFAGDWNRAEAVLNEESIARLCQYAEAARLRSLEARRRKVVSELLDRSRRNKLALLNLPQGIMKLRQRLSQESSDRKRRRYQAPKFQTLYSCLPLFGAINKDLVGDVVELAGGSESQPLGVFDAVGTDASLRTGIEAQLGGSETIKLSSLESLPETLGIERPSSSGARVIFLSAGIPDDPKRGGGYYVRTAEPVAIREAIHALVPAVLERGDVLVFGGHPAITPMVLAAARSLGREEQVHIYQSLLFKDDFPPEAKEFKNFHATDAQDDLAGSLALMRDTMLGDWQFAAGVFIGGMDGIEREFEVFRQRHSSAITFPIGSTGGGALKLCTAEIVASPALRQRLLHDLGYRALFRDMFNTLLD